MATNLVIDAKLSKWSYSTSLNNSSASLNIDGWQPVKVTQFIQTSTNFSAQLFKGPDGSYKIAYRGTASLTSSGDTTMNGQSIVLNRWTQELTDSIKFTHAAINYIRQQTGLDYDKARALLSVTGHSQGGFESEVVAKFFGLGGTSLDGPGASAITQTQDFANLKNELQASEPQLQSDYSIGEFVARRYTFIVGALNSHVNGVATDNSIASLTVSAQTTLLNPLVSVGVQAQFLHKIDNIIEMETLRATSRFWQILGVGETTDVVAQIGGYMYPTNTASTENNVSLVTPDPAVMEQITNFLANEAGPGATVYVRDGATYIEGNGTSLLIRKDGSGERWITSGDTVIQEILGGGSVVTNRVETWIVDNQTITETSRYSPQGLVLERRIIQTLNSDETVTREVFNGANELVVTSTAEELGDGSVLFTDVYPDGSVVTRVEDALLETATQPENGAQTLYNAIATYGPTLLDSLSLIKAIQSGEPLPIVASGLRL
ncbi:MAG: alpha/beta hydrolase family protein, partial [Thiobacillus sp.]